MAVEENDEDKNLITGEVINTPIKQMDIDPLYRNGDTVIFGRYALLTLTLQGEEFHVLDIDDIIGTCNYKE